MSSDNKPVRVRGITLGSKAFSEEEPSTVSEEYLVQSESSLLTPNTVWSGSRMREISSPQKMGCLFKKKKKSKADWSRI